MSARIVLLSLPVRVGKTTFLREWARSRPPGSVGGICGPEEKGLRVMEEWGTGLRHPWELGGGEGLGEVVEVGRFRFRADGFRWGLERLWAAAEDPTVQTVLVDELGPLEVREGRGLEPGLGAWLAAMRQPRQAGREVVLVVRDFLLAEAVACWGLQDAEVNPAELIPPLGEVVGVVLAGGRSTRMGRDKAYLMQVDPANAPEQDRLPAYDRAARQLLRCLPPGAPVAISGPGHYPPYPGWPDRPDLAGAGPRSGLLTLAAQFPGRALLVVGVDYPHLMDNALHRLLACHRLTGKSACFAAAEDGQVEPLVSLITAEDCAWLGETGEPVKGVWTARGGIILPHDPRLQLISIDTPQP
jgi:molybdopterin-guanine dinucleotide biosynthesis protein A